MILSECCIKTILKNFNWNILSKISTLNNFKLKNYFIKIHPERKKKFLNSKFEVALKTDSHVSALITMIYEGIEYIVTGHCDGLICILSIDTLNPIIKLNEHHSHINSLVFIKKDNILISAGYDGYLIIWDLKQKKSLLKLQTGSSIFCIEIINKNELEIVTGQICSLISIWKIKFDSSNLTYNFTQRIIDGDDLHGNINSILYLKKLNFLISGSNVGGLKIWKIKDLTLHKTLPGHPCAINSIIHLKENIIATSSRDKSIRIWDITKAISCIKSIFCFADAVLTLIDINKFSGTNCFCAISYKSIKLIEINDNSSKVIDEYPNDNYIYKMIPLKTSNFVYAGFSVYKNEHIWFWN